VLTFCLLKKFKIEMKSDLLIDINKIWQYGEGILQKNNRGNQTDGPAGNGAAFYPEI
jgi:hypothetical protein